MSLHWPRPTSPTDADLFVACYASLSDWGGGRCLAHGASAAASLAGLRSRLIGVRKTHGASVTPRGPLPIHPDEAPLPIGGRLWMLRHLVVADHLANWLRTQPRPRSAFVAVSPFWVLAARSAWPDVPVGYLFPCLLSNCMPFVNGPARSLSQSLHSASLAWLERRALRAASSVFAPTRLAREEIAAFCPGAAANVVIAPVGCHAPAVAGVDREAARRRYGLERTDFAVLAAGVLDRNKAFDLAIRALANCSPRVRLLLAGDGPEQDRLVDLAERLGVQSRVRLLGSQSDMAAPLAAADAALSTSQYDTYPNVLLEALSAGRPILAPRHDPPRVYAGINELIARGAGLIYERADENSLTDAIDSLAQDARRHEQLCTEARNVGSSLDWSSLAMAIRDLVRSSAARPSAATMEPAHVG